MSGDPIRDVITAVLLGVSALMSLAAAIGLVRWKDPLTRMHAGAKPQILGVLAAVAAIIVQVPTIPVICTGLLVVAFQVLTQPIGVHMIGRSAYRTDHLDRDLLDVDELADDVEQADRDAARAARQEAARHAREVRAKQRGRR